LLPRQTSEREKRARLFEAARFKGHEWALSFSEPREAFDVGVKVFDHRRRERRARFGNGLQIVLSRERRLGAVGKLPYEAFEGGLGGFAGGASVAETDDATWEQMRDLNLTSAFYVLRAAIPHLPKSAAGRIVAIGSLAALEPHAGLGAYLTFKSALVSLVRTVALENKDAGLTANVVLPGTMDTPANRKAMPRADFSKWLKPADAADLVLWLADERAAHITETLIPIDGANP